MWYVLVDVSVVWKCVERQLMPLMWVCVIVEVTVPVQDVTRVHVHAFSLCHRLRLCLHAVALAVVCWYHHTVLCSRR